MLAAKIGSAVTAIIACFEVIRLRPRRCIGRSACGRAITVTKIMTTSSAVVIFQFSTKSVPISAMAKKLLVVKIRSCSTPFDAVPVSPKMLLRILPRRSPTMAA